MAKEEAGYLDPEHPQRKYYKCEHCGKPFWREDAFRLKYCGPECLRAAMKAKPRKLKKEPVVYEKVCEWCGKSFKTTYPNQKYCTKDCGYEGNRRLHRQRWAEQFVPKLKTCKECGSKFMTECGSPRSVFCCQSCADKYERRVEHKTERHKDYMRELKRKRERQIRLQSEGNVSYDKVYERDKGICQICGMPVHRLKNIDSNWDGTIDHVIPLSLGGKHSMDNCQLAHRICNSMKLTEGADFRIDWKKKSNENNYWMLKLADYKTLMGVRRV